MSARAESILRILFCIAFAGLVAVDGGVSYAASATGLLALGGLLGATAGIDFERSLLHRLRFVGLLLASVVVSIGIAQVWWDPTGLQANPIWQNLQEQFAATGGARAVMRLQPVWELPGLSVPFVAFAVAVPLFRTASAAASLWRFVAATGAVFAAYGILQTSLFPTWHFGERSAYLDSLSGFYVNRNVAAAFLVLTSLATLHVLDRHLGRIDAPRLADVFVGQVRPRPEERRLALTAVMFLVQFVALFLTKSRAGSLVGLVAIAAYVGLRSGPWREKFPFEPSRRVVVASAACAVALLAVLTARVGLRYDVQGADDARWCAYPAMIRMAYDNLPWGVGYGGFVIAYAGYRLPDCGLAGVWDSAHDGFIQGVATMGLAFPLVLAVVLATLLPPLLAARRRDDRSRSMAEAVLVGGAALAIHSLVDFPLEIPANVVLLGTMAASAIGVATEGRRRLGGDSRPRRIRCRRGRTLSRRSEGG